MRPLPKKFRVAFSFAGEQRELVRAIAEGVERVLGEGAVFFDEWYEYYTAGADADLKLQRVYGVLSDLVVVCVSAPYGSKPWTRAEHEAIRARLHRAREADDQREREAILPIRVGDGDVDGLHFTTITPDVRDRPEYAADLIVHRLGLVTPDAATDAPSPPVTLSWPDAMTPLAYWPMADHRDARAAFEQLLTRQAPWRYLSLRGSSETGKSHITRQMLANALTMPNLACGRFDFKGTTDIDTELRAMVQHLDVPMPPGGLKLNDRLSHVLDSLRRRARPSLLVFDTYEAAGEARDWVEKQLLLQVMRDAALRVVVAGQQVPEVAGAVWAAVAHPPLELRAPLPEEWFAFGQLHKPDITMDFVQRAHELCRGKVTTLAQLFGPGT